MMSAGPQQPCSYSGSTAAVEQERCIHHQLFCLSEKIQDLQMSEEDRLSRELQAIELNIQETRWHMDSGMVS